MADVDMDATQTPRSVSGDLDLAGDLSCGGDLADGILSRLGASPREEDQHLCAAVAAMAQTLKDQGIAATPVAYFGAAAGSLDRLSRGGAGAADHVAAAVVSFLAAVLPAIPVAVARGKGGRVAETVSRILEFPSFPDCGVKAGLRCISHLVMVGEKSNWAAISPLYGVVVRLATDHRAKVRKQSHSCLQDILRSFQNQAVLVPASEGITGSFERFLLLAGGSNSINAGATEEGPKGAKEILYILNALRYCLPLMAPKSANIILKYFKALLDLHQPILTRNILDILHAVGDSPTLELKSEVLLDLLISLCLSISSEKKSADEMALIARLLHVGTRKVYNLNKNVCIVKLPLIFSSLGDILASEFEEAIFAAVEAFKGLINNCIDESLVTQGVTQIIARHKGTTSGPTIIEKICATLEGLLDIRYSAVWDKAFHIISVVFDNLGESSSYLMANALKILVDMENIPDEDFPYRKQLDACLGSAVAAMGPNKFVEILQIQTIHDENAWLLPILEKHIIGASLRFFSRDILGMVRGVEKSIPKLLKEDKLFSAKRAEGYVYSLWSLLPSFCNYPCDTASSFEVLQNVLCDTLRNEPNLRSIICSSLQVLIEQNKGVSSEAEEDDLISEDEVSKSERRAKGHYTKEVAEENLKVIRTFSSKFLEVLCSIFLESSKDTIGFLQPAIHEIASISDKKVVGRFFIDAMKKLLGATQEAVNAKQHDSSSSVMQIDTSNSNSMRRALLLDFAASLMPGLASKEIDVLFSSIKPAIQDGDSLIQKRAYKVLSVILKDSDQFLKRNLDVLLELMISSLPCQFPSKRYRLECLYHLIVYILKDSFELRKREIVSSFLTEILLALKETNKKTRNRAYDLLIEIGRACEHEENDGRKENLHQFFNMVAGGLASQTPYAISAAVTGLARLTYEFSELIAVAYKLLPSTFLLMQRNNREIVKANLGFIKALVAKSKADALHDHLRGMVEGLLNWQNDTKNSFKAKVKSLIEMLVKKCGLDAVKAVMPEEHMKLLTNIRKINERKMRKARSLDDGESMTSRTSISRQSRWNHTQMFSDFGCDDDDNSGSFSVQHTTASHPGSKASLKYSLSKRKRRADIGLSEEFIDQSNGEPLDLLDQQTMRSALKSTAGGKRNKPDDDDDDDELEIDPEGRIIVREESKRTKKKSVSTDDDLGVKSFDGNQSVKRRKTTSACWAYTGQEYTSKKAGGDIKKKDKLEPYAYWPLDRKLLNRRAERKADARKGMASVMKVTKRLEGKSASSALSITQAKLKRRQKKSR